MKEYCIEYEHEGSKWALEIWAESWEDAEQKVRAIGYGKVLGTLEFTLPVGLGWLGKVLCWWKNRSIRAS